MVNLKMIELQTQYGEKFEVGTANGRPALIGDFGHVFAQSTTLVAFVRYTAADRLSLERKQAFTALGSPINGGQGGEQWIQFEPRKLGEVAEILKLHRRS